MNKKIVLIASIAFVFSGTVFALEDLHTGTVVVGSGISGLKAAIDLKEAKKDVIVVEKMPFLGGTTNLAAQYFVVVDTEPQRQAGKTLTVADYLKRQEKAGASKAALKRTAEQLYSADEAVKWLNQNGADLTRVVSDFSWGSQEVFPWEPDLCRFSAKRPRN